MSCCHSWRRILGVCLSRRWGLGAARRRTTWSARGAHQQAARGAALPASGESHAEDGARGAEKGRGLLRPNLERGVCQSGGGPHRVSPSLIAEQWDEMLRLATRPNRVTASLLVQPPSGQLRGPRSPTPCWTTGRGWSRPSSSCSLTAPYDRRSIHHPRASACSKRRLLRQRRQADAPASRRGQMQARRGLRRRAVRVIITWQGRSAARSSRPTFGARSRSRQRGLHRED
jgi:hypothetical protein